MDIKALTQIPLFRSVPPEKIEHIFEELSIKEKRFRKSDILAMQDESCNRLIILATGSVKAEMTDASGKIIKVEDISAPSPLAILFLFGTDSRFPVQITAIDDISAFIIPKQSIIKMLGMDEIILKNYLDISADFASRLSKKLHFLSFKTIRQKLSMYLLELSQKSNNNTVELNRTKTALAEYFGVSRQSLERELTNMQNDGLIMSQKKRILIRDKSKLVQLVQFS